MSRARPRSARVGSIRLVEPLTRGDPMSPLRWTCKSAAKLAGALTAQGWPVSATTVGKLLDGLGYRLHALQKAREGAAHPDRNAQLEHINATAAAFTRRGQPVISVDTKKEFVGDFKNGGREWQPTGAAERVRVHDFPGDAVGKAIPYGVYDMARNEAWVSVGRDHDTPAFAVASIRQWWTMMGRQAYPVADALYITAAAGGSNGYRTRGWKAACNAWPTTCGCVSTSRTSRRARVSEQGRAPTLLSHYAELARPSASHLRDPGRTDRPHADGHRAAGQGQAR